MARTPLIRTNHHPYHITARSNNREWFYIPIEEFWKILLEVLSRDIVITKIRVHALVLMSNHFHLLASSVDGNLDEPMRYLLREVCRQVNKTAERMNHLFGGPYKWSVITNTSYYLHCLKYVYRNPVTAGICERVEDYPFSSITAHRNPETLPFPLYQWKWAGDWMKWGDYNSILQWLNTPYPHGLADYLKKGFHRPKFQIPKDRKTRRVPTHFWDELQPLFQLAPFEMDEVTYFDHQK
jgi:putative transposase